jgi:phasin family protein
MSVPPPGESAALGSSVAEPPPPIALAAASEPAFSLPVSAAPAGREGDLFAIIAESRSALARGVESISDEFASFVRHSIDVTADTAIRMLAATTWSDAVAVNARFARTSYDRWLDSSTKVSELGVRTALESSKPFVNRIDQLWRSTTAER